MSDPTETAQILQAVGAMIDEKLANLIRFTPGTVTSFNSSSGLTVVDIDGDLSGSFTTVENLTGRNLIVGQRVMIQFVSPGGAFVIGIIATTDVPTPAPPAGWLVTNLTPDRVMDANTASTSEVRNVVGTIIIDLIAAGIISP